MQTKSVLITGCSSGIGYHVAHRLREDGYKVIASARQLKDVEKLQQEGFFALHLDLADENSIRRAVDATLEHTQGTLYGLFNNGAYGQAGAVEDLSIEALRQQFEVNVFGWMLLTNLLIPVMRKQGSGRIIQNSSVLGFVALKFRGAYVASKYAIEGFSDTLRLELKDSGVYVSLVEPGPIESKFRENSYAAYKRFIDPTKSFFQQEYLENEQRLQKEGNAVPFTLPPEAVYRKVEHALTSSSPRARYYVTFPTYLFGYLKRLLPSKALDTILKRI